MLRAPLAIALLLFACDGAVPASGVPTSDAHAPGDAGDAASEARPQVLVFSRTTGFRHDSIGAGVAALRELGAALGFDVDATEDAAAFTDESLRRFRAVVFLSTSGDVLDAPQERAFETFVRDGGGFLGVHAATDTEYDWPFYQRLVGAAFRIHPPGTPRGRLRVLEREHLATAHLPAVWERDDEWYSLRETPEVFPEVHVLVELDEESVPLGAEHKMPGRHPVTWMQAYGGGRAFTTTLGHSSESFSEPAFRQHLAGALAWVTTGALAPSMRVQELDGVTEPGAWVPHASAPFDYVLGKSSLSIFDMAGVNEHLTRQNATVTAGEPYSIDALFTIPRISRNGATDELNSFAINFDVQGEDGREDDVQHLYARALNLDLVRGKPGTGVTKFMGFVDGVFAAIGEQAISGVDFDVEYRMAIDVNVPEKDRARFRLMRGATTVVTTDVDFSSFPYVPAASKPVRAGVNTHGTDWTMRDFRLRMLTK